jgi:hypothetical protein
LDSASVLAQLERVLSTPLFRRSRRYPAFLRYVVEQTLQGAGGDLKERTLGVAVFRRSPEYDTSADPVVRNTASEVRKRLEGYYSGAGHEGEVRISLPAGAYVPEFHFKTGKQRPRASISGLWFRWAVSVSLVLAALVLGAAELVSRRPPFEMFWAPILRSAGPVLVVTDTLVAIRQVQPESGDSSIVREIIDPKIFLNVSEQSAKLASFLVAHGRHPDYELARAVSFGTLKSRPFILAGAFNNQWTLRAVAPFRFHFQFDREAMVRRIIDRQNPVRRDWSAPMISGLTEDYALIARAQELETRQMMLVIAGLGEKGSAAALEFVTNPKCLSRFANQAPAGWERRNIELVIKTNLVNGDEGEPQVVAAHFW